jgi:hypothetical protein
MMVLNVCVESNAAPHTTPTVHLHKIGYAAKFHHLRQNLRQNHCWRTTASICSLFVPPICEVQPFLLDGDTGHKALMPGVRRTGDNGHKARYQLWLMTMAVAVGLLVLFAATRVEVDIVGREGQQPSGPSLIWQL